MSGSRSHARVQPPGPALSVCVSSIASSVPVLRVSSRSASWNPSSGRTIPMFVSAGSARTQATSLARSASSSAVEVVELHDLRRQRRVNGRPDIPGARPHDAVLGRRERLVDRPVVAPVEDEHLPAAGHLTGEPQCEAVRVGRGQRELPEREPEAPRQLLADPGRVLGRKHRRRAARRLGSERLDDRLRRVPGHRARVAEAEVDVLVAVDVDDPRALRLLDEHREAARPASHPAHRDAEQERRAGALAQLERTRMALAEGRELVLEPRGQPIAVDRDHPPARSLHRHQLSPASPSRA